MENEHQEKNWQNKVCQSHRHVSHNVMLLIMFLMWLQFAVYNRLLSKGRCLRACCCPIIIKQKLKAQINQKNIKTVVAPDVNFVVVWWTTTSVWYHQFYDRFL